MSEDAPRPPENAPIGGGEALHPVGRIRSVYRYPVKSMAAQPMAAADLGWHGLEGDRRYAFRRRDAVGGFPWLTATRLPELVGYRPESAPSDAASPSGLRVSTPEGEGFALEDPALCRRVAAAHGAEVELAHLQQGIFDEASVSLISTSTVARLERDSGVRLDPRRFRPNLLVDAFGDEPFAEDAWVGRRIVIGGPAGASVWVTQRDPRCAMVNLDPDTAAADPRVLRTIVRGRANFAGVYAVPVRPGPIGAGATVYVAAAS